jgi:hypothetical protein
MAASRVVASSDLAARSCPGEPTTLELATAPTSASITAAVPIRRARTAATAFLWRREAKALHHERSICVV